MAAQPKDGDKLVSDIDGTITVFIWSNGSWGAAVSDDTKALEVLFSDELWPDGKPVSIVNATNILAEKTKDNTDAITANANAILAAGGDLSTNIDDTAENTYRISRVRSMFVSST